MAAKARLRLDGADPINQGLFRQYPFFGAGLGAIQDISPYRRNAAYVGTPTRVIAPVVGAGLTFDGSTNYVDTGITNLNNPAGTVVWWQRTASAFNSGTIRGIWGQVSGSGEFSAQVFSNNYWYIGWRQGGTDQRLVVAASAANWPSNAVTFYAYTYNSAGSRLYVNGALSASTALVPNPFDVASTFAFGAQTPGITATYFNGSLWLPRLFRRELTPGEIARLYRAPWAGTARPVRRAYATSGAYSLTLDNVAREYGAGALGLTAARRLALDGVSRVYGAGAANLTVARTLALDGVSRVYGAGDITFTKTRPMALDGVSRLYGADDMTMTYDGTGAGPHGVLRRRVRRRLWADVPEDLKPVVALAEEWADESPVQRAVDEALDRYARISARASIARRDRLVDELKRAIVQAVERAKEADDEEALIALL